MKLSKAMQIGWDRVGAQCKRQFCKGNARKPRAVCALGAAQLTITGDAQEYVPTFKNARNAYAITYGRAISEDNDRGMEIPEIIERLKAIGE